MDTLVGFRFHPTDEEYLRHYLHKKNLGHNDICSIIPEIDLCNSEPRELPRKFRESSLVLSHDPEWWFFCEQGQRAQRSTKEGFWKITGHDRKVMARVDKQLIGIKKTLVFHEGKGRKAKRTSWVMHEYHLPALDFPHQSTRKFTLCRIKCKEHYEHDSNPSSYSQSNNHVATYFDDSVPVGDHSIPEVTVQATMAWLLEPESSQFMSSCPEPILDQHYAQSTIPCPLESVKVPHHLNSPGLEYQNKEESEDSKDPLNENPQDQHSGQAKQPCSLEPDSLHSGLHKKSSVDSLPHFTEDVQKKKNQPEDVKGFQNQFGPLEIDSKKDTNLNSVDGGVTETDEDKCIVKDKCDSIIIPCLVGDPMESFLIKQEFSCSSYYSEAGPSFTVPKKSRKIQENSGMSNDPESPTKLPRSKLQSSPSTAATLQATVLTRLQASSYGVGCKFMLLYFLCRLVPGMQMKNMSKASGLELQHLTKCQSLNPFTSTSAVHSRVNTRWLHIFTQCG